MRVSIEDELNQKSTLKLFLKLALPSVAAQIFNAVYSIVDRIFIGHIEGCAAEALTGIGLCYPIISLITAVSWLVGMGGAPLLSIAVGEKKYKDARKIQGNSLALLIILGFFITLICYTFSSPILVAFGASEKNLTYASQYLKIYCIGSIATLISMGMNPFINAQGRTDLGTITVAIGAIANIVLDYIFIFAFNMGIGGAAAATVLSQILSGVFAIYVLVYSLKISIHIDRESLVLDSMIIKRIFALGVSSFVFMANESLAAIALNLLIRIHAGYTEMGDLYIGALSIITTLSQILFMPLKGMTQGLQPIVGFCYGAMKIDKMKQAIKEARVCAIFCAVIFWLAFMTFPYEITQCFTSDNNLIRISGYLIRLSFWECFLFGLQMINQHMFVAMGNAKWSFIFAVFRKVILLIPIAVILAYVIGTDGIFIAEPIATIITVILTHTVFQNYVNSIEENKSTIQGR